MEILINDLNEAIPSTSADIIFFKSTFQPANLPAYDGNYWFGFTMRAGEPNYFLQIAYGLGTTQYARQYYAGTQTWGSWRQI